MSSSLRSILLHLDASPRSAVRMQLARQLAEEHDAAVTALYATAPTLLDIPLVMSDGASGALPLLLQLEDERRDAAHTLFEQANAGASNRPMQWRELRATPVIRGVAEHSLCTDLMVLGQFDADDVRALGVPQDLVASALIASGQPALVVPYAGEFKTVGRRMLVAWKPTREAARAVCAALPLLRRAERVHLSAPPDEAPGGGCGVPELEAFLRLHGVAVEIARHGAVPEEEPGEGLLSLAADVDADLLVMGCYGHSRARELVLGGASRTVLKSMTLPVLMAH